MAERDLHQREAVLGRNPHPLAQDERPQHLDTGPQPQQLPRRPGHHAHRVVARLDQTLIKAILLKVSVGLQADKKDCWLHLIGTKYAL